MYIKYSTLLNYVILVTLTESYNYFQLSILYKLNKAYI